MSTAKAIIQTNISIDKPAQLTRRQLLIMLATAPFAAAALPTSTPPANPLTDEAAYVKMVLIPTLEQCLAQARARLAQLTTSV